MNNLSSFEEFSKGTGKQAQSINFSIPISGSSSTVKNEEEDPELSDKPARHSRAHQQMMKIEEETSQDEVFKTCYDVVDAEYKFIMKDLNRMEYSDQEMKKHVTELKKSFNDLLVKLQFFSEKGAKK